MNFPLFRFTVRWSEDVFMQTLKSTYSHRIKMSYSNKLTFLNYWPIPIFIFLLYFSMATALTNTPGLLPLLVYIYQTWGRPIHFIILHLTFSPDSKLKYSPEYVPLLHLYTRNDSHQFFILHFAFLPNLYSKSSTNCGQKNEQLGSKDQVHNWYVFPNFVKLTESFVIVKTHYLR